MVGLARPYAYKHQMQCKSNTKEEPMTTTDDMSGLSDLEAQVVTVEVRRRCGSSPDGEHAFEADGRCHYCPTWRDDR